MAHLYLNDMAPKTIVEAFNDHFLPYYRQFCDPGDDELYHPKTPDRAFKALAYYASVYKNDLYDSEILEYNGQKLVEIGGKIDLADGYTVSFRQDTIMRNDRGIFSLEHKTGSSSYNWNAQWYLAPSTAIYTHVLYCLFPPEQISGIKYNGIFFKRTKDDPKKDEKDPFRHFEVLRVPIFKSSENMGTMVSNLIWWLDMIKFDFNNLAEAKDTDTYMPCFAQNWGACTNWGRVCEYHDFCCNWRNPLRYIDKLPMDIKIEFWNPLNEPVKVEVNV
jgi:hypothetical protein